MERADRVGVLFVLRDLSDKLTRRTSDHIKKLYHGVARRRRTERAKNNVTIQLPKQLSKQKLDLTT